MLFSSLQKLAAEGQEGNLAFLSPGKVFPTNKYISRAGMYF